GILGMELGYAGAKFLGRTADFVYRNEAVVDVADRVFQSLGQDGSGELLELESEVQPAPVHDFVDAASFQQQRVAEEIEDALRHSRVQTLSLPDCVLNVFLVARSVFTTLVDVRAVNREASDGFANAVTKSFQGEVTGATVARRNLAEQMGEHVHLAGQGDMHNELLPVINQRVDIGDLACKAKVNMRECTLIVLVDEKTVHQVREFVSAGSINRPFGGQLFTVRKNLLHDRVKRMLPRQPVML